jgi:hypothetical protein
MNHPRRSLIAKSGLTHAVNGELQMLTRLYSDRRYQLSVKQPAFA